MHRESDCIIHVWGLYSSFYVRGSPSVLATKYPRIYGYWCVKLTLKIVENVGTLKLFVKVNVLASFIKLSDEVPPLSPKLNGPIRIPAEVKNLTRCFKEDCGTSMVILKPMAAMNLELMKGRRPFSPKTLSARPIILLLEVGKIAVIVPISIANPEAIDLVGFNGYFHSFS